MKNFLRIVLLFLAIYGPVSALPLYAQVNFFLPAPEEAGVSKRALTSLEKNYQQSLAQLPPDNKKDLVKIYKERWNNIEEKFTNNDICFEGKAVQYLQSLVAEIVRSNEELQNKSFQCYFSKSGIPNAEYLGEGLILVNMGLFSRLQNESQVAFIICHELAHYHLLHSEKSILSYVKTLNSKETQQELKTLKKTTYGKRAELENLLQGLTFNSRRHGRLHESEADSLAIAFLKNTRFDMQEALNTLAILDSIDTDTMQIEPTLQKMFDFKDYPFRKKWIAKEEGLLGGHARLQRDETLVDSLKTHPDCQKRIQLLNPLIQKYAAANATVNPINAGVFRELTLRFKYEVVEHYFITDNYTKSLLYTLALLAEYPADPYLISQVGKIFNGLYQAQSKHTLSKVTELPAPYFEPNYNLLLQFIQNLYKEDFAAIGYHFLKQYAGQLEKFPAFQTTYQTSIANANP